MVGVFADVGEGFDALGNRVCGEDADLHRFLSETETLMGAQVVRIKNEKFTNIWDVFFKERMLGSTLRDPCSRHMKRKVIDDYLSGNFTELDSVRVLGFSWQEMGRVTEFNKYFQMWRTWFPVTEPPYVTNDDISEWLEARGVARPRLIKLGYSHNNCGGFCVKMGIGQARDLWILDLPAYLWNEEMEQKFRREINADATIFRKGGKPITMRELRALFEAGYVPKTDKQICGGRCMIPSADEQTP